MGTAFRLFKLPSYAESPSSVCVVRDTGPERGALKTFLWFTFSGGHNHLSPLVLVVLQALWSYHEVPNFLLFW